MGVRGLKSFVECNSELLLDYRLHDTKLIIDGNNLLYKLTFDSDVDVGYGGDYKNIYDSFGNFFGVLKKCNIIPIVVFDGGYFTDNRKLKTTLARAKDRLQTVIRRNVRHQTNIKVLPLLSQELFFHILYELEISFVQCDFEADSEIAALANYYQCPVLSQDSDFYIFEIPAGFIPIDSLNANHIFCEGSNRSLKCQIYYVDNFLKYFPKLDRNLLPLFGTLLGNDYVGMENFENFYANLSNLPKYKSRMSRKKIIVGRRFSRMLAVLQWLEKVDASRAVDTVVDCIRKENRNDLRNIINDNISLYERKIPYSLAHLHPKQQSPNRNLSDLRYEDRECKNSVIPAPDWFIADFKKGMHSSFIINIICLSRVFLPTQIEDIAEATTYECSVTLRKAIYGILNLITPLKKDIDEYYRCGKQLIIWKQKPQTEWKCNKVPKYDRSGTAESNEEILKTIVDEDTTNTFPEEFNLMFLSIRYWIRNASPMISEHHLNATILCLMYYGLMEDEPKLLVATEDNVTSSLSYLWNATSKSIANNLESFEKFTKKAMNTFNIKVVHNYCQLQSCIFFTIYLMRLLSKRKFPCRLKLLNGRFIHNLSNDLEGRSHPDLYISQLLGRDTDVSKLFCEIRNLLLRGIEPGRISKVEVNVSRGKSRKKRKSDDLKSSRENCTNDETVFKSFTNFSIDDADVLI